MQRIHIDILIILFTYCLGAGKSTLLNLIMGKLNPVSGNISRNGRLRIGYFTQQYDFPRFGAHCFQFEQKQ